VILGNLQRRALSCIMIGRFETNSTTRTPLKNQGWRRSTHCYAADSHGVTSPNAGDRESDGIRMSNSAFQWRGLKTRGFGGLTDTLSFGNDRDVNMPRSCCLALQLSFLKISESMGNHDTEIEGAGNVDRRDACAMGGVAFER
jgi:hypothetical protein